MHAKTVHGKIRNHKCDSCDKRFAHKDGLVKHVKTVHDAIRAFICDLCEKHVDKRFILKAMFWLFMDKSDPTSVS